MGFDISKITNAALKALAMKIDESNENGVVKNNTLDNGYEISIFRAKAASIIEKDEEAKKEFNNIVNEEISRDIYNASVEMVAAFYPELIEKYGLDKAIKMFEDAAGINSNTAQANTIKIPYEIDGITRKDEGFKLLEENKINKAANLVKQFFVDKALHKMFKNDKANAEQKPVEIQYDSMSIEEYNKLIGNQILNDTEVRPQKNDK